MNNIKQISAILNKLFLLLLLLLPNLAQCRVYNTCELANELRNNHLVNNNTQEIATWVCIAYHQSSLNSAAIGGGGYYGLFQISSEFWCNQWQGANKACAIACSQLMNEDLQDDFECLQVIFAEHQRISGNGFNAWTSYQRECDGDRAINYIEGCFDNYNQIINDQQRPGISSRKQTSNGHDRLDRGVLSSPSSSQVANSQQSSMSRLGGGRIYDRCELAKELVNQHSVPVDQVAMWVCIARFESNYNTSAIGTLNADGSGDHGIFQISDIYWCSPPGKGWACGLSCDKLEDEDISDDVKCMQKIYKEHQRLSGDGFNAWTVYPLHCKGRAEQYIEGCFLEAPEENEVFPTPGVIAPQVPPRDATRYEKFPEKNAKKAGMIYDRCTLARELVDRHGIAREKVATWVCIAQHESHFNTSAVGRLNADGSGDHGLFQISDIYWCSPPGVGWVCGLSCAQLEDNDITDDVKCMKKIYAEHEGISGDGFNAWTVYRSHCAGDEVEAYVRNCFNDYEQKLETSSHRPGLWQPSPSPAANEVEEETAAAVGKVYSACELAHELMTEHQVQRKYVATWVCIAQHESNFNTSAVGRLNADGSEDHGLFQISDLYWCDDKPYGCGVTCAALRDSHIKDDVKCMKKIHKEHQRLSGDGFNAWTVYNIFCKGQAEKYVDGCGLRGTGISVFEEFDSKKTTPLITANIYPFFFSRFSPTNKSFSTRRTTKSPVITSRPPVPLRQTTSTPPPRIQNNARDKEAFSIYDLYLKGTKYATKDVYKSIFTTTTTVPPQRTISTTKKAQVNYYAPQSTTTTTTERQKVVTKAPFTYPTKTTTRVPAKLQENVTKGSKSGAFNIFDLYLKRTPGQKANEVKTTTTTPTIKPYTQFKWSTPRPVPSTSTLRTITTTTFDPFSVFKFNRNLDWRKSTETSITSSPEPFKWTTTTPSSRRNLVHRSPAAYQSLPPPVPEQEGGGPAHSLPADSFGVPQVTVKPFSFEYINRIGRNHS